MAKETARPGWMKKDSVGNETASHGGVTHRRPQKTETEHWAQHSDNLEELSWGVEDAKW